LCTSPEPVGSSYSLYSEDASNSFRIIYKMVCVAHHILAACIIVLTSHT
jgi:hypothetical protein